MNNLIQIDHPVLKHKLGYLRDKRTHPFEFRSIVKEISRFLAFEATRDLVTKDRVIETPLGEANVKRVDNSPCVVTIMRAGNGMLDAILESLPFALAGHIGIYRDKFINNTVEYYFKLPTNVQGRPILLADPLLATGDTAIACVDRLKQYDVGSIKLLTILSGEPGLKKLFEIHPDVQVYTVGVEKELNSEGYLIPGLGDAGDRLYNTR